jgi:PleD family two-component response regulator
VTITIGVAETHAESVEELLIHADRALYAGKLAGRNCVITADRELLELPACYCN